MIDFVLSHEPTLSSLAINKGITTWQQLLQHIRSLPYGRNSDRADFSLVLKEGKGSCSSKHAFLKLIANENNIVDIRLMLAIYKMNKTNTSGIGSVLHEKQLTYIPEAHCYLKAGSHNYDVTNETSDFNNLKKDIILEMEIEPHQVIEYKVTYHRHFLRNWLSEQKLSMNFDELCIL